MVFKKESFGLDAPTTKLWDTAELAYDSEESNDEPDPLHPEDWQDWYSEQLLDAWEKIREYADSHYLNLRTTYPKFVEFVMEPHRYFDPIPPTHVEEDMWNIVCRVPVISDRIIDINFFTWVRQNIDRHCNV